MRSAGDRGVPLRERQAEFLADLGGLATRTPERRAAAFEPPPAGTIEDRWAVYTNAYVVRLAEALANDFPAAARIVGGPVFRSLASRYLRAFPPVSFDIGRCGDRLPGFLATDELATALPFLPDLARFEWALAECVEAPDVEPLRWADLANRGAESVARSILSAVPGAALIRSPWPLHDLWRAKDRPDGDVDISVTDRAVTLLVWRVGFEPRWRVATAGETALVAGAASGATVGTLFESGAFGDDEDAPARAVEALRRVVNDGYFAGCRIPERTHPFR